MISLSSLGVFFALPFATPGFERALLALHNDKTDRKKLEKGQPTQCFSTTNFKNTTISC